MQLVTRLVAVAVALTAAACNSGASNPPVPAAFGAPSFADDAGTIEPDVDHTSILKMLAVEKTIGSTVDPTNGDLNPHGLVYVKYKPLGKSVLQKGDVAVCNFSDKAHVQGKGTTIVYMGSTPGQTPKHFAQSASLLGCASLVINSFDEIFAADQGAKNAVGLSSNAKIVQTLKNALLVEPWGSAYVPSQSGYPPGDGLWISDASSGKIVRINLGTSSGKPTYTSVITGFAVNHGQPGSILAPSGLQYNAKADTLYVVDGITNTLVAFHHAYREFNQANSVTVSADGKSFSGPSAKDARLVYAGSPLEGPISSTLLPNGNLVLGNTLNKKGKNLLVEIATDGSLLAYKNVNTGKAGAIFGLTSSGYSDGTTQIFFNNDNSNTVEVLEK